MSLIRIATLVVVLASSLAPAWSPAAQAPRATKRESPDAYPSALPGREGPPPPSLTFVELRQFALPGPLPGHPWMRADDGVRFPVSGGSALLSLAPDLAIRLESDDNAEPGRDGAPPDPWVYGPEGRFRYRCFPEGRVLAEKRGRKRWKRAWNLRVAGATLSPPVAAGQRLFFGAVDNQVYAVRRDNGHRLWATDIGDRVSGRLTVWRGAMPSPETPAAALPVELILLIPDDGGSLVALDPYDGARLAAHVLADDNHRLIPPPLSVGDGRIVVATQRYAPEDAALLVLSLRPPEAKTDEKAPLAYNEPDPTEAGPAD